jgi:hypothetical protein
VTAEKRHCDASLARPATLISNKRRHWSKRDSRSSVGSLPLRTEAVAETITSLNFLYVCDKVTILGRTISVAEDPLCPAELLSRGQRNWPLSDSYNRFGLCDSLDEVQSYGGRPRAAGIGAKCSNRWLSRSCPRKHEHVGSEHGL